jgi:hypothetical protein
MNSELFQLLFAVKMKIADELIDHLPSPIREKATEVRRSVIKAVHDATDEYLKSTSSGNESSEKENKVTAIPID